MTTLQAIECPAAWKSKELAADGNWRLHLTPGEKDELVRATEGALEKQIPIECLTAAEFPLPRLSSKIRGLREVLEGGRGFIVLHGIPVDRFSLEEAKVLHWGFGQYLGYPEPQDKAGKLLHVVTDTGANVETTDNIRSFQTNDELTFHTDGADVFALLCIRPARTGGGSRLVSSTAIYNELLRRDHKLAAILVKPFHFDARAQNPWEQKIQTVPIFTLHNGMVSALYKRRYIELAQRFEEVPRLTADQVAAMDLLDEIASDPDMHLSLNLEPGDMEIANNATCFHARFNYTDYDDPNMKRCMLRLWLSLPNGRPLPPIFETTREWGPTYARRAHI
ncbi:MAG: TauD/TfdA family dioxygenase [Rhodospirillales bacterium]